MNVRGASASGSQNRSPAPLARSAARAQSCALCDSASSSLALDPQRPTVVVALVVFWRACRVARDRAEAAQRWWWWRRRRRRQKRQPRLVVASAACWLLAAGRAKRRLCCRWGGALSILCLSSAGRSVAAKVCVRDLALEALARSLSNSRAHFWRLFGALSGRRTTAQSQQRRADSRLRAKFPSIERPIGPRWCAPERLSGGRQSAAGRPARRHSRPTATPTWLDSQPSNSRAAPPLLLPTTTTTTWHRRFAQRPPDAPFQRVARLWANLSHCGHSTIAAKNWPENLQNIV